jgi:saccharopine dehydrogenase-like NADP-dependent oxidoreductase
MRTRIVVLGGAGAMGRIAVRDLVETAREIDIVVADFDLEQARRLVRTLDGGRRIRAARADARDVKGTTTLLAGAFAVINATHHRHNLSVMRAALGAHCHYIDLGGLFHVTREQVRLHPQFKRASLTAILGLGAAPGITNLLARAAADRLDTVREVHLLVGSVDRTRIVRSHPLASSYSIETLIDEFTLSPAVFTGGRLTFVAPLSGEISAELPMPVGQVRPMFTIHSEVFQLARSLRARGVREVTFRIAFDPDWRARLAFLAQLGLLGREKVRAGGIEVSPREVVLSLLRRIPPPLTEGRLRQHEVLRAIVVGSRGARTETHVVDCHCAGIPKWSLGLDADTGCPPSIGVQMLLRGEITARGALPADDAVPVATFFAELQKRGMRIEHGVTSGRQAPAIAPSPRATRHRRRQT